ALEETDLPRGAILDDIEMRAGVDAATGAADAHAHAVRHPLGGELFVETVAHHRFHVEADLDARSVGAVIDRRKVAEDAAPDLHAFGPDLDGFGDDQIAVALHRDVADKAFDALFGKARRESGGQYQQ